MTPQQLASRRAFPTGTGLSRVQVSPGLKPALLPSVLSVGLIVALLVGLTLGATVAAAGALQTDGETTGDIVVSCPEGTILEGSGQNLTCLETTTVAIDALEGADGTLSCRDGSVGIPTAANPTCESVVRNSIRPEIRCNGDVVAAPGDGDACNVDTDQDGVIDGEDFAPNDANVGAEAPPEPTLEPIADPSPAPIEPADEPDAAPEDLDTSDEPVPTAIATTGDDTETAGDDGDGSGGSGLVIGLAVLGGLALLGALALGYRSRNPAVDQPDTY